MSRKRSNGTMNLWRHAKAVALIAASFLIPAAMAADPPGELRKSLVGPSFEAPSQSAAIDFSGLKTASRRLEETHPIEAESIVTISSEFGRVEVVTWDSQLLRVQVEVKVGTETAEEADALCAAATIQVTRKDKTVSVASRLPKREDLATEVNYKLTVPGNVRIEVDNFFGDTRIAGIGRAVVVRARYGAVDLKNIKGPVRVRAVGAFPLVAQDLRGGGRFVLRGVPATFSNIAGHVIIGNYMGIVQLSKLAPKAEVEIISDSGPIFLELGKDEQPALAVTSHFGTIETDLPLQVATRGNVTTGGWSRPKSTQRITLESYFDNIYVRHPGAVPEAVVPAAGKTVPVEDVVHKSMEIAEEALLVIDAIVGDVRVVGVDENRVTVTATRLVRMDPGADARLALDALALKLEKTEDRMTVATTAEAMADLGCRSFRVDLLIQCPRTVAVELTAAKGNTKVEGMGSTVEVHQASGALTAQHVKGSMNLVNERGDVKVTDCAGPVDVEARYGNVTFERVYGPVMTRCEHGRTTLDALLSEVVVRQTDGDVRVVALDGVGGDYDIEVVKGNLKIVLPEDVDAALFVTIFGDGEVHTTIPLTGTYEKDVKKFQTRLQNGMHTITLTANDGDIRLD